MLRIVLAKGPLVQIRTFQAALKKLKDAVIVAQTDSAEETLQAIQQHLPDLLVTDLHLADLTETVIRKARAELPALKVVVLTERHDEGMLARLRSIPIDAYILAEEPSFTQREREVLSLLADGRPNQRIAEELCLAPQTVRNCVSKLYHKLRTRSRVEAARLARRHLPDL